MKSDFSNIYFVNYAWTLKNYTVPCCTTKQKGNILSVAQLTIMCHVPLMYSHSLDTYFFSIVKIILHARLDKLILVLLIFVRMIPVNRTM